MIAAEVSDDGSTWNIYCSECDTDIGAGPRPDWSPSEQQAMLDGILAVFARDHRCAV